MREELIEAGYPVYRDSNIKKMYDEYSFRRSERYQ